jgi:hypothetical protein
MAKLSCSTALLFILASPAAASDFVFGIGQDDVDGQGTEAVAFQLEYHTNPLREYSWGKVSGMVATQVDDDSGTYVGVGLSLLWITSDKWFVEGNFAVGYYDEGDGGTDLGSNLQFRTLVGFGYRMSDRTRLSIAIDHLSNAGVEKFNPGREAVSIRYGIEF